MQRCYCQTYYQEKDMPRSPDGPDSFPPQGQQAGQREETGRDQRAFSKENFIEYDFL